MTVGQPARFARAFYPRWNDALLEQILDHFGLSARARIKRLSGGERAQYRWPWPWLPIRNS